MGLRVFGVVTQGFEIVLDSEMLGIEFELELETFSAVPGLGRGKVPPHTGTAVLVFIIESPDGVGDPSHSISFGAPQYPGSKRCQKDVLEVRQNPVRCKVIDESV